MTILVKKVFISSKPTFVYLLCPPLCGPFSIQESAAGGLSYKVKKAAPAHFKQGCRILTELRFFYDSFMTLFCTGYGCTSGGNTFPVSHLLPAHPG